MTTNSLDQRNKSEYCNNAFNSHVFVCYHVVLIRFLIELCYISLKSRLILHNFCFFRYIQVGNAVAVPVAKALGYALGIAFQGLADGKDPLLTLPEGFAFMKPNLPSELA